MKLPNWKDFQEGVTGWDEMDPVYEDILAQALDCWPNAEDLVDDYTPVFGFDVEETPVLLVTEPA